MNDAARPARQWKNLLSYIEEGMVVPVVGRDLLWTTISGKLQHVQMYLAEELARECGLDPPDPAGADPLGAVVQAYLRTPGHDPNWPYNNELTRLTRALQSTPVPEALLQLAELPFPLLVSTTFDAYLARAVSEARFGGRDQPHIVAYNLKSTADLPGLDERPTVFQLLGRANPPPDYAVTEEDVLEFVHEFQVSGTPRNLWSMLRQRHLLLIGNRFPDWLARFFSRIAKPHRLWVQTPTTHFVADAEATRDPRMLDFLQHPLSRVNVFPTDDARGFVAELHARWRERHPAGEPVPIATVRLEPAEAGRRIFISYASEDYEAASRVATTLRDAGMDVWFDKRQLEPGDAYKQRIRDQIQSSLLFVALLSRHSLTDEDRFFRFEWKEADEHASFVPHDVRYVIPILLDGTSPNHPRFPPFLRALHATSAPDGVLGEDVVSNLRRAYRDRQRRSAATA